MKRLTKKNHDITRTIQKNKYISPTKKAKHVK